ncbi:MAG: 2OG-Fe(II) oxygenase [Allosphingosinicella sp.]
MDDEIIGRIQDADWEGIGADLDANGWAILPGLLAHEACAEAASWWGEEERFRSRINMARHGFGRGEYRYFAYPLPAPIEALRSALYPHLSRVANRWNEALGLETHFPPRHTDFLAQCHAAGQSRPTPLILRYGPGDFNALHQDLYGKHVFPLQAAILLSRPGADFDGGEFLLTEQRPRMQSRGTVVPLSEGDALLFAVSHRPVRGSRGWYRTNMRHGVSTIRAGDRHTLGIIFHDAT